MKTAHARSRQLMHASLTCVVLGVSILLQAQSPPSTTLGLRIIVVDSSSRADLVLKRLKNGQDFAAIAKEVSTDPTSAQGGYMGPVDPATLRSELRDALKGIAPGQITGVIRLPSGYAILSALPASESPSVQNTGPARILPTAAVGGIRYAPNVGGKGEADLAFRNYSKPEGWSQDLHAMCEIRKQSLASVTDYVTKSLDPASADSVSSGRPLDAIQMRYALANVYAYQGEMDKSIEQWETAYQLASTQMQAAMPELEEVLGIAYL